MIIAVCNQKGGVGKTTLATNIAAGLATQDAPALVVDGDPQGNATTALGLTTNPETLTLNDVLAAIAAGSAPTVTREAIQHASPAWPGVDILPADRLLASREADTSLGRESRLATALQGVANTYAHIIIDCPPALGMLTTNALVAADQALIVSTARETSADGVAEMVSTIATVRTHYNHGLSLAGIVVNQYLPDRVDRRTWKENLAAYYGQYLIDTHLPEREYIARAASTHAPIPHGIDPQTDNALTAIITTLTTTQEKDPN
ncbi:Soj centromere-like function involved in forespore chromosome partition [Actinobaculum suis]|uniref:Soj centromere-like function involved in forespore chromosome partition n=1 Tax=Actinobaculum suis TaxID=1657 RepID=A0A7Z9C959_9ACTO|nr:ParA family protein [Actinobaculum suis]VDG75800.1 Soj centromere-like function involved in forespore chromosome partition [Actinobaculum suis]